MTFSFLNTVRLYFLSSFAISTNLYHLYFLPFLRDDQTTKESQWILESLCERNYSTNPIHLGLLYKVKSTVSETSGTFGNNQMVCNTLKRKNLQNTLINQLRGVTKKEESKAIESKGSIKGILFLFALDFRVRCTVCLCVLKGGRERPRRGQRREFVHCLLQKLNLIKTVLVQYPNIVDSHIHSGSDSPARNV